MTLSIVAKDGSKPSVSCLNFEPRVSKFPVIEVGATSITTATMKSHYLFVQGDNGLMWSTECVNDFIYSGSKDGSKPSVSCLTFEPSVSKVPVIEVGATSITSATMKRLNSQSKF